MVRETRYLWVANLTEKITEDRISDHFKRYGKIQSVKFRKDNNVSGALVAFTDIKSAAKAHNAENVIDDVVLRTEYSEPTATTILSRAVPDSAESGGPAANAAPRNSFLINRTNFGRHIPNAGLVVADSPGTINNDESAGPDLRPANKNKSVVTIPDLDNDPTAGGKAIFRGRQRERTTKVLSALAHSSTGDLVSKPRILYTRHSSAASDDANDVTTRKIGQAYLAGKMAATRRAAASSNGPLSRSSSTDSSSRSRSSSSSSDRSRSISTQSRGSNSRTKGHSRRGGSEPREEGHLGIFITGLPMRSTDSSLRDGLFHEYKKYGKVVAVSVQGQHTDRFAIVTFKKHDDASKALEGSQGRRFFGAKIVVTEHEGIEPEDSEYRPPEAELDEYHPKSTRTLFVGNLEKDILPQDLKDIFSDYGEIIDVDIKKQPTGASYAFVQFTDITSVVKALHKMDGENIGANKIKLGFGKSMPTNCIWIDGVTDAITEKALCRQFSRHGPVQSCHIDRELCRALLYYESVEIAQYTTSEVRGRLMGGRKLQVDFASRDCQLNFFEKMERTHQMRPGDYPDERLMMRPARTNNPNFTETEERFDTRRRFDARPQFPAAGGFERRGGAAYRSPAEPGAVTRNYRGGASSAAAGAPNARYPRELPEDYVTARRGRHSEEYVPTGVYPDDEYGQELREFSRRRDFDSPSPFDSRESSPVSRRLGWERYEDNRYPYRDMNAGETDARYRPPDAKIRKNKKDRNLSPTGSEYSQSVSSQGYRSRSDSPNEHKKGRARTPVPTSPRPFDDFIQPGDNDVNCRSKKRKGIKASKTNGPRFSDSSNSDSDVENIPRSSEKGGVKRLREEAGFASRASDPEMLKRKLHQLSDRRDNKRMSSDSDQDLTEYDPTRPADMTNLQKEKRDLLIKLSQLDDPLDINDKKVDERDPRLSRADGVFDATVGTRRQMEARRAEESRPVVSVHKPAMNTQQEPMDDTEPGPDSLRDVPHEFIGPKKRKKSNEGGDKKRVLRTGSYNEENDKQLFKPPDEDKWGVKRSTSVPNSKADSKRTENKREPMDLPLPKFAYEIVQSPRVANSPKSSATSPKGVLSPQISPGVKAHISSPPFSPTSASVAAMDVRQSPIAKDSNKPPPLNVAPLAEDMNADSNVVLSDDESMSPKSPLSPAHSSLEERIRALDEKISKAESVRSIPPSTSNSDTNHTPAIVITASVTSSITSNGRSTAPPIVDYAKYKVKKRVDSQDKLSGSLGGKNDKSDRTDTVTSRILSRSSVFDQDSLRLEQKTLDGIVKDVYDPAEPLSISGSPSKDLTLTSIKAVMAMDCSADITAALALNSVTNPVSADGLVSVPKSGVVPHAPPVSDVLCIAATALAAPLESSGVNNSETSNPVVAIPPKSVPLPATKSVPSSSPVVNSPATAPSTLLPPAPPVGILKKTPSPPRPGILKKSLSVDSKPTSIVNNKVDASSNLDDDTPDLSPIVEGQTSWKSLGKESSQMPILKPETDIVLPSNSDNHKNPVKVSNSESVKRKIEQSSEVPDAKVPKIEKLSGKTSSVDKEDSPKTKDSKHKSSSDSRKSSSSSTAKKDDLKSSKEKSAKDSDNKSDKSKISSEKSSASTSKDSSQKPHKSDKPRSESKSDSKDHSSKKSHSDSSKKDNPSDKSSGHKEKTKEHKPSESAKEPKQETKSTTKDQSKSDHSKRSSEVKKADTKTDDKKHDGQKEKSAPKKSSHSDKDKKREGKKEDDKPKEKESKKDKDKKEEKKTEEKEKKSSEKCNDKSKQNEKDPKDRDGSGGNSKGKSSDSASKSSKEERTSKSGDGNNSEKKDEQSGGSSNTTTTTTTTTTITTNTTNSDSKRQSKHDNSKKHEQRSKERERDRDRDRDRDREREHKAKHQAKQEASRNKKERLPAAFRELKELGIDIGDLGGFSSMYDNIKRRSCKPKSELSPGMSVDAKKRRPSYLDSECTPDSSDNDSDDVFSDGKKKKKKSPQKPMKKNHAIVDISSSSDEDPDAAILKMQQKKKASKKSTADVYPSSDSDVNTPKKRPIQKKSPTSANVVKKTSIFNPKKKDTKKHRTPEIYTSSDSDEPKSNPVINRKTSVLATNTKPRPKISSGKGKLSELYKEMSSSDSTDYDSKKMSAFDDIMKPKPKKRTLKEEEDLKKNNIVFDKISSKIKALTDDQSKINETKIHEIKSELDYIKNRKSNDFAKEKTDKVKYDNCVKAVLDLEMHASLDISRSNSKYLNKSSMIMKDSMYNRDLPLSLTETNLDSKITGFDIHRVHLHDEEKRRKQKSKRHFSDIKETSHKSKPTVNDTSKYENHRNDVIKLDDVTMYNNPIIFNNTDHGNYYADGLVPIENEGVDNVAVAEEQTIESCSPDYHSSFTSMHESKPETKHDSHKIEKDIEPTEDVFSDVPIGLHKSDSEPSLPELIIEEEISNEVKVEVPASESHLDLQPELELKRSAEETDQAAKLLEEVVMKEETAWDHDDIGLHVDESAAQIAETEEATSGLDELQAAIASLAGESEPVSDTSIIYPSGMVSSEEDKDRSRLESTPVKVEPLVEPLVDTPSCSDETLPLSIDESVPTALLSPKTETCTTATSDILTSPSRTSPSRTSPTRTSPTRTSPSRTESVVSKSECIDVPEPSLKSSTPESLDVSIATAPDASAVESDAESQTKQKKKKHKSSKRHSHDTRKSADEDEYRELMPDKKTEIESPLAPLDRLQSMSAELFKPCPDPPLDVENKLVIATPQDFLSPSSRSSDGTTPIVSSPSSCDKTAAKRRARRSSKKPVVPPKEPMSDISLTIDGVLHDYDEKNESTTSSEARLQSTSDDMIKPDESSTDSHYDSASSPRRKSPSRSQAANIGSVVSDIKARLRPENKRRKPKRTLYMDENENKDKSLLEKVAPIVTQPVVLNVESATLSEQEREKKMSEYDFHDDDVVDDHKSQLRLSRGRDAAVPRSSDDKTPEKEEGHLVIDESSRTPDEPRRRGRSRRKTKSRGTDSVDESPHEKDVKEAKDIKDIAPVVTTTRPETPPKEDTAQKERLVTVIQVPTEKKKKRSKRNKDHSESRTEDEHEQQEVVEPAEDERDTSRLQDEVIAMAEQAAVEAGTPAVKDSIPVIVPPVEDADKEAKKVVKHTRTKSAETSDFLSNIDKIIAEVADGNFDIKSIQDDPSAPPRRRGSRSNSKLHDDRPSSVDTLTSGIQSHDRSRTNSLSETSNPEPASMPPPQFAPYHQDRYPHPRDSTPPQDKNSPITPSAPSTCSSQYNPYQESKHQAIPLKATDIHHPAYRDDCRSPPSSKHYAYPAHRDSLVSAASRQDGATDLRDFKQFPLGPGPGPERIFFPSERHLERTPGKDLSKSPNGKLSPRSQPANATSVHMGVVQGPPFTIAREAIQSGQLIERVPNPNLGLMEGLGAIEKLSPSDMAKLHSPKGMIAMGSEMSIRPPTPLGSPNHPAVVGLHGSAQKGVPGPSELRQMLSQPTRQGQLRPPSNPEMQLSPHGPSAPPTHRLPSNQELRALRDPKHEISPHAVDPKLADRFLHGASFPPDHRPDQFYPPEFMPHSVLYSGIPGIPVPHLDPRVMFQGQRPEYLPQQNPHLGLAMVPPHQAYPPHGRLTPDSRPPSRPLSAHGPPAMRAPLPALFHVNAIPDAPTPTDLLLQKYPVMWQGSLALKNDSANVQMHFVSGGNQLVSVSLPNGPIQDGQLNVLRIAQRMRLEAAQLDAVAKRMMDDENFCMLLALPCGRDDGDLLVQTQALKTGFIHYLQQKQAAGIVNMPAPGTQQTAYVVHIFPPCEFSKQTLAQAAPDLYRSCLEIAHVLIVIATV